MSGERRIEYLRLDELVPALRNPRRHEVRLLRQSMERFGFTAPVIRDERTGRLVAGHGRMQVLRLDMDAGEAAPEGVEMAEGGGWLVPVVCGWASADDAEADAYLIADNRLTEIAEWDTEALMVTLGKLQELPDGLLGIGYNRDDVDDLFASLQEKAPQAPPPPPPPPPPNERNSRVRSMVLDYPLDDYAYVTTVAHRARHHFGVDSNAELFQAMLEAKAGELAEEERWATS